MSLESINWSIVLGVTIGCCAGQFLAEAIWWRRK